MKIEITVHFKYIYTWIGSSTFMDLISVMNEWNLILTSYKSGSKCPSIMSWAWVAHHPNPGHRKGMFGISLPAAKAV